MANPSCLGPLPTSSSQRVDSRPKRLAASSSNRSIGDALRSRFERLDDRVLVHRQVECHGSRMSKGVRASCDSGCGIVPRRFSAMAPISKLNPLERKITSGEIQDVGCLARTEDRSSVVDRGNESTEVRARGSCGTLVRRESGRGRSGRSRTARPDGGGSRCEAGRVWRRPPCRRSSRRRFRPVCRES